MTKLATRFLVVGLQLLMHRIETQMHDITILQ